MSMQQLKPCACGNTPEHLGITDGGQGGKYNYAAGSCCGEWMIEFRANYKSVDSDECMALAVAAWNAAPRAEAAPDLLAALETMLEVHDEPCRFDHNGNCQSHYLDHQSDGCRVQVARDTIKKASGE